MQPTTVVAYWPKPARPTRGSTVFFLLPGGEAAACPMAGEPRWILPACVPPRLPGRRHAHPPTPSSSPLSPWTSFPSSGPLSLSSRAHQRAPPCSTTATGHPTPRRRAKKPRLVPLFLLTKAEGAGSPVMPPTSSSSSPVVGDPPCRPAAPDRLQAC